MSKRTIPFTVTLSYQCKEYTYTHDFYEMNDADRTIEELAEYMYTQGNYSCDCNKSDFIREHCDETFPEMECGEEIKLVSLSPRPHYARKTVYVLRDSGLYLPCEV